jgi:hypothetical protein
MLSDAIDEIRCRLAAEDERRRRRAEFVAPLRQAEDYAHRVEEVLVKGGQQVPADLAADIRDFVRAQSPELAQRLRPPVWEVAAAVLDLLFDLQEQVQHRMGRSAASAYVLEDGHQATGTAA